MPRRKSVFLHHRQIVCDFQSNSLVPGSTGRYIEWRKTGVFKAISAQTGVNTVPVPAARWLGCDRHLEYGLDARTRRPRMNMKIRYILKRPQAGLEPLHTRTPPGYFLRPPFPMRPRPSAFLGLLASVKRGRRPDPFPLSPVSYPTPTQPQFFVFSFAAPRGRDVEAVDMSRSPRVHTHTASLGLSGEWRGVLSPVGEREMHEFKAAAHRLAIK